MNNKKSDISSSILEAAIDGITESYLVENNSRHRALSPSGAAVDSHLKILVKEGLLAELADKSRSHVAYRTTQQGLRHLLEGKSLRSAPSYAVVEA